MAESIDTLMAELREAIVSCKGKTTRNMCWVWVQGGVELK